MTPELQADLKLVLENSPVDLAADDATLLRYGTAADRIAQALLAAPQWHDRPPVDGTYIITFADGEQEVEVCDANEGIGERCYGPIPADAPTGGDR